MNIGWKSVAWSAAALFLLLSIPTMLNIVTLFLLMTPMVVLYTMLKPLSFAAHMACVVAAAFLLSGSYAPVALTFGLFFLIPSIVMGHLYKKRTAPKKVILIGFVVLLAQLLLELIVLSMQFDLDLSSYLTQLLEETARALNASGTLLPEDWASDTADQLSNAIVTMLPALLLLASFALASVTHILSRRALAISGIETPALPQMRTWMLPRSMVFYYLIALVLSFVIPADSNNFLSMVTANAVPVLRFAFTIQAIAFFFYLASVKGWHKAVPVLIAVPILLYPPFYLIGLLDVAFPLRKNFTRM
ncbi:DUF2232 domain-containing protein [Cohnella laeviribosi]|uniref:DUF2232 domain-containing protein n=1 Tax=Cohnella laeviribosi TaxID=380174 RepID=UPI003D1F1965